jgi:predicted nucleic acid-binding protein
MDVTLDTGALIAMEKRKPRGLALLRSAREQRTRLLVITPVLAEWWRGRSDVRDDIKKAVRVVPFPESAAEAAGVVLGAIGDGDERVRLTVDVMVMAFAATEGGALVYTSDLEDMMAIRQHFPEVRVLGV